MTAEEKKIYDEFDAEVAAISDECVAEGYPSHGSNFELRYEQLYRDYQQMYPEVFC